MMSSVNNRLPLDCETHGIPSTQAQRGDAFVYVAANHLVEQRSQDACASGADGMS